jgi:hypothetical protein
VSVGCKTHGNKNPTTKIHIKKEGFKGSRMPFDALCDDLANSSKDLQGRWMTDSKLDRKLWKVTALVTALVTATLKSDHRFRLSRDELEDRDWQA